MLNRIVAMVYQKQWTNPRTGITIPSVDMEYGTDKRDVPVLLALMAARKDAKR